MTAAGPMVISGAISVVVKPSRSKCLGRSMWVKEWKLGCHLGRLVGVTGLIASGGTRLIAAALAVMDGDRQINNRWYHGGLPFLAPNSLRLVS